MEEKECPMCGEIMRLRTRKDSGRKKEATESTRTPPTEWVCPECDHFEEADESEE